MPHYPPPCLEHRSVYWACYVCCTIGLIGISVKGDPAALARTRLDLIASTLDLIASIATPCFGQVRPSCRSCSPSWRQLGATSLKIYQKPNPETKTPQESSNLRQTCPEQLKNHPPDLRKSSKSDGLLVVFILFPIPTHPQKETRKSFQNCSEIVPKEAGK